MQVEEKLREYADEIENIVEEQTQQAPATDRKFSPHGGMP